MISFVNHNFRIGAGSGSIIMLAKWIRTWDTQILKPLLILIAATGIKPNGLTILSLIAIILAGFVLSQGKMVIGGFILILGGCLDGLDGELARHLKEETGFGAFLDSISDHLGDFAVYFGLMWLYLKSNSHQEVMLLFLAFFGSIFGSQVRSRAGMIGIDTKTTGLFTRFERILVLVIGLFSGWMFFSLLILAVMNNFSALQRTIFVIQKQKNNCK